MEMKRPLYGPSDERGPSKGRDVKDFVKRTLHRMPAQLGLGENFFPVPPGGFDDVYNRKTEEAIEVIQKWFSLKATGQMGKPTFDILWTHADNYSKYAYRLWSAPKPKPIPPPLVEPNQGYASLHQSLWVPYSRGRQAGMSDLGTHNPDSNLPSGAPSDHAVYPAMAFDLGIDPDTGWQNDVARTYFYSMMGDPAVEYLILGTKIWSRPRASEGIRTYTGGGHENHVHVSGNR
jgi:hypothetical protein